ncbi:hypothetical protein ACFX2C_021384 [Malus domestica]
MIYTSALIHGKDKSENYIRTLSPDWNELTTEDIIHNYDMVEAIEDFSGDQGVLVTPSVNVAGFYYNTKTILASSKKV